MNIDLQNKISGMASISNPTVEQLDNLIMEWDDYFDRMRISGNGQEQEFEGIMKARFMSGKISLMAPNPTQ